MPIATLLPTSDESSAGTLVRSSGSSFWPLLDDDDADTNTVRFDSNGFVAMNYANLPSTAAVIRSVKIKAKAKSVFAYDTQVGRMFVKVYGTKYYSPSFPLTSSSYMALESTWELNPGIVDVWNPIFVNGLVAGFDLSGFSANSAALSFLAAEVDYLQTSAGVDSARDVASRRVWLRRRADRKITLTGPPRLLDFKPGSRIELSHIAGLHATDPGWKDSIYERRPLWVESVRWNPATMTVTLTCIDHRPKLCMMFDSGYATVAGVGRDGLLRISPGAIWTMTRSTSAEVQDATGRLVSVPSDVEALAARGQVIQGSRTNVLLNSGWGLGIDVNWTSLNEGSNGSNITEETNDGMWTTDLSARCLKIQAGNPIHVADLSHRADAVTALLGIHPVVVYHKDSGGALSIAAQRSIDSKWYRASDQTWQAALTWNALTQRADWERDVVLMDLGAASTNLTLYLGIPTTGAAGQYNLVAQAQVEVDGAGSCPFATSPIFTLGSTVTRAADDLKISNDAGKRVLNASQFTIEFEAETFWDPANITGGGAGRTLCLAYHDANNNLTIRWDKGALEWQATMLTDGVSTVAKASHSPSAGQRDTITVRFIGANGELGLAPFTLAIFVNGVMGATTAIAPGPMTEASTSYIQFAGFDGYIRQRFSSPQVLTDVEISRGI